MGFLDLLVVALVPILKVLLVTGVGLFLGMEKINLLGPEARDYLNKIVFYVLSPCLLLSNLAETITYKSLVTLWFMPLNVLLTFLVGSALGWILAKLTKTPRHLQGIVIGCCSTGNLGNLLLIVFPDICDESNSPFSKLSTCSTDAEAYASLSMAVGAIFTWAYAYPLVSSYVIKKTEHSFIQSSEPSPDSCTEPLLSPSDSQISEDNSVVLELPLTNMQDGKKMSFKEKIVRCIKCITSKIDLEKVFVPSTIASIAGLIIGIVSPFRKVLIADNAPLRAAIPSMTLIMGANLLKGLQRSEMSLVVILGVVAVRNICLPLLGIGVVQAAHHLGVVGSDALYRFVLMFQYAVPPAINVGTMTQLFKSGQGETSVILLWSYSVAAFSLTLWSTLYMSLVSNSSTK
ncbi:hypothetical protein CXB51_010928 [Gossypium anomalum]|uniref:Protein PIN-LIKES 3-like n=1 Tax=Gossypium anomalum TaxID=47600 RepID=A0A8J5ZDK3_9ROSI|nr:hypothetical protein CXB51_010928 [Gossypium anomalum]